MTDFNRSQSAQIKAFANDLFEQYKSNKDTTYDECVIEACTIIAPNSDFTLEDIGFILNITRERVRQIESSAIKKLKHPKVGRKVKNYIEYN